MTTSHVPTLGLVEVPAMGEVLRQVGYRVISGSTFPEAASAVKTAVDDVQSALAAQQAAAVFPILIADVHRPGIKAWAQKSSRTSPVLILRGGADESQNYIVANEAREIRLPATIASIASAAALPVAPDARMQLVVMPDGSVVDPAAGPAPEVAASVAPTAAPVEPAPQVQPVVQVAPPLTAPVPPAPVAVPVQHFAQQVPAPAAPAAPAPVMAPQAAPAQPALVAPAATARAPWDTRESAAPVIAAEPAAPEAPLEVPTFERSPQLLFPDIPSAAPAPEVAPVADWASSPVTEPQPVAPVTPVISAPVAPAAPLWATAPTEAVVPTTAEPAWALPPVALSLIHI